MVFQPKVAVIMGSNSDAPKVQKVIDTLGELNILHVVRIFSAHRTPEALKAFIADTNADVFIAAAGMSAALAGVIASQTTKPVIGLPLSGSEPNTITSLLSTVQMPPGIPVMTVGVDAGKNAALAAARILSLSDPQLVLTLKSNMKKQAKAVLNTSISCETNNYTIS